VVDLLTPALDDVGLDLEGVELIPAGRRTLLRVVVDADGGVTLDQLAETSVTLGKVLDAADVMGTRPYTLEVTSRGVDRPLTAPRHWRRNQGRLVRVVHHDGSELTGRVTGADDESAGLEVDGHVHQIEYAAVAKARVQVEFSRLPAAGDEERASRDEAGSADGEG